MIDPEHLFQLADELTTRPRRGRPRRVRLRRAVSTAYYALFHSLCTQACDLLVGGSERDSARYSLVYRSFEHRELRSACSQIASFGQDIRDGARQFLEVQAARFEADYNPSWQFTVLETQSLIGKARDVIARLDSANKIERNLFLTGLKFRPRP